MWDTLGTIWSKNKEERAAQFWTQWCKTQPCKIDPHLISFSEGIISETSWYVKALPRWLVTRAVPERLSCWSLLWDMFHSAVKSKYLSSVTAVATAMSPVSCRKPGDNSVGGGASAPQDKTLPDFSSHLHRNNSTAFKGVALSAPNRVCWPCWVCLLLVLLLRLQDGAMMTPICAFLCYGGLLKCTQGKFWHGKTCCLLRSSR